LANIVKKGNSANIPPVGAFDPSSGRYYVLYPSNNVYYLGIYNTQTGRISNNVVMYLDASLPAELFVIESKVYVLINRGADIYLYQIDPTKNMAKEIAYFDNSQTSISGYQGVQYSVDNNRILLITNVNSMDNTATYVIFDPITSLMYEYIGNDQIGAFNDVYQVCLN